MKVNEGFIVVDLASPLHPVDQRRSSTFGPGASNCHPQDQFVHVKPLHTPYETGHSSPWRRYVHRLELQSFLQVHLMALRSESRRGGRSGVHGFRSLECSCHPHCSG